MQTKDKEGGGTKLLGSWRSNRDFFFFNAGRVTKCCSIVAYQSKLFSVEKGKNTSSIPQKAQPSQKGRKELGKGSDPCPTNGRSPSHFIPGDPQKKCFSECNSGCHCTQLSCSGTLVSLNRRSKGERPAQPERHCTENWTANQTRAPSWVLRFQASGRPREARGALLWVFTAVRPLMRSLQGSPRKRSINKPSKTPLQRPKA